MPVRSREQTVQIAAGKKPGPLIPKGGVSTPSPANFRLQAAASGLFHHSLMKSAAFLPSSGVIRAALNATHPAAVKRLRGSGWRLLANPAINGGSRWIAHASPQDKETKRCESVRWGCSRISRSIPSAISLLPPRGSSASHGRQLS